MWPNITVLVLAHRESPRVRDALKALDIPAVIARGDTVLDSPAASKTLVNSCNKTIEYKP